MLWCDLEERQKSFSLFECHVHLKAVDCPERKVRWLLPLGSRQKIEKTADFRGTWEDRAAAAKFDPAVTKKTAGKSRKQKKGKELPMGKKGCGII